ncbi:WD repeat-containing and planar cell polarity effector protein fritz homolog isoform X2 [Ptychodera flava]|uniref:WD repeat-containing and planar cell polarity effector protein fritz homolog isoform X2 n=1 Tax=Ptychodera flava TaxID=63121 RepID=UPI00396A311D
MASLLGEFHVWSLKNLVAVADGDIGCYTYHDKGEQTITNHYLEEKQQYAESRDVTWIPKNRRPEKLRDTIRELEELLATHKCVHIKWKGRKSFQMILSNGVLITIYISVHSGDIDKLLIDKTLQGKLAAEPLNSAVVTDNFFVFSYPEKAKVTLVYFNKKPLPGETPSKKIEKVSTLDPKISHLDVPGPKGRKLERKLSVNTNQEWIVVWWPISGEEAWPWSPMSSDRDRANIVILGVSQGKLEELCFVRSEYDPIHVAFSSTQPRHVYTLEVGTSAAREAVVDSCIYECSKSKIQRATVTTIPTKAGVTSFGRNSSEDKLILACDDAKVVLYDEHKRLTQYTQAELEPSLVAWHPGGCVVFVASNRGEVQCFDMALNPLQMMLIGEDPRPFPTLQFATYFRSPSSLVNMSWCRLFSPAVNEFIPDAIDSLLLVFDRGPLAMLQIHLGVMSRGKLGAQQLVRQYLHYKQSDEAVNLLTAMNWNTEGTACFVCLSAIMDHLLRYPLNDDSEAALEAALGTFYAPPRSLSEVIIIEYRDAISRLARRFFHHLLRYQRFEKAFLLAVDLHSRDLSWIFITLQWTKENVHWLQLLKRKLKISRMIPIHQALIVLTPPLMSLVIGSHWIMVMRVTFQMMEIMSVEVSTARALI